MSLDMIGHIDGVFQSHLLEQIKLTSAIVDFEPSFVEASRITGIVVTVQPLNPKEIEFLGIGGERIRDMRKVYRNDGGGFYQGNSDQMVDVLFFSEAPGFVDATYWKVVMADNRPWRNYAKAVVEKLDPTMIERYGLTNIADGVYADGGQFVTLTAEDGFTQLSAD